MINSTLNDYKILIDSYLDDVFSDRKFDYREVIDAMAYSVKAGGKRIRPILTLEFGKLCGTDIQKLIPLACAVELVHTYSLVHDDLPCMDDDDMRRGQPSCHKKFGEATALLAGDGLLTMAFELITKSELDDKSKIKAVKILSQNAGIHGMIGGQVVDLAHEGKSVNREQLDTINLLKTAALIEAACLMGCVCDEKGNITDAARVYAKNLGLAFQITDDILDVTGDALLLGKPIGSDAQNLKDTYVTLLGVEECKRIAGRLTYEACNALEEVSENTEFLTSLARYLCDRNN